MENHSQTEQHPELDEAQLHVTTGGGWDGAMNVALKKGDMKEANYLADLTQKRIRTRQTGRNNTFDVPTTWADRLAELKPKRQYGLNRLMKLVPTRH